MLRAKLDGHHATKKAIEWGSQMLDGDLDPFIHAFLIGAQEPTP